MPTYKYCQFSIRIDGSITRGRNNLREGRRAGLRYCKSKHSKITILIKKKLYLYRIWEAFEHQRRLSQTVKAKKKVKSKKK